MSCQLNTARISTDSVVPISVFAQNIKRADGLVMDKNNNLYVACEKKKGDVVALDPSGQRTVVVKGLHRADGLAQDKDGNLYISMETSKGQILKYHKNGTQSVFVTGINKPEGIVFDSQGRLFIAEDRPGGRIIRFQNGEKIVWASGLNRPEGITLDEHDNLYINETDTNRILRITADQQMTTFIDNGILKEPDGITYCSIYEGFFVTEDQKNGRLFYISLNGKIIMLARHLSSPQGIVCDNEGNLFLSEQGLNRILKIHGKDLQSILPY